MSVNKIDVEKKRAEEKKLLSVMIGIYCRGNHGGNDGNKKELCDSCKKLEEYALFRTENAHLWKQRLFAVPVRFTVMQKNSGNRFVQSCVMQDRG